MGKNTGHTDHIPGTHVFTGQRSRLGYNLNKFAYSLHAVENREAYKADADGYMDRYKLTDWEKQKIREQDWKTLVEEAGANIYMILKIGAITGEGLGTYGAKQRGETLEEFMKTRNVALRQNT